jgi:hypothetical protein
MPAAGFPAFPDRIAFGIFAGLVAFLVLKAWMSSAGRDAAGADNASFDLRQLLSTFLGPFLVLLCFPPLVTLLKARMAVWEEAVAHEYFYER